jgi:hypothetical protein
VNTQDLQSNPAESYYGERDAEAQQNFRHPGHSHL